jgi:hypothetical protein
MSCFKFSDAWKGISDLLDHAKNISGSKEMVEILATPVFSPTDSITIKKVNDKFITIVSIDIQVGSRQKSDSRLLNIQRKRFTETLKVEGHTNVAKVRQQILLWMKGEAQQLEENLLSCHQQEKKENSTVAREKLKKGCKKSEHSPLLGGKIYVSYNGKGDDKVHRVVYQRHGFGANFDQDCKDLIQCSDTNLSDCTNWSLINEKGHDKQSLTLSRICKAIKELWRKIFYLLSNLFKSRATGFILDKDGGLSRKTFRFSRNTVSIKRTEVIVSAESEGSVLETEPLSAKKSSYLIKKAATQKQGFKVLKLKGDEGTIECKIYGISGRIFPHISREYRMEFKLRSYLRLRNLTAFRGKKVGARMIGPLEYYGNLERPDKYLYTIEIKDNKNPQFFQIRKENIPYEIEAEKEDAKASKQNVDRLVTKVKAKWISGRTIKKEERTSVKGESLFPDAGILKLEIDSIQLKKINSVKVDLSSFKARLVPNHIPFQITTNRLHAIDEYRAITYHYEPGYAEDQVANGGGVFLETHPFAQTLTPLSSNNSGFVTLGRWNENCGDLELVGVEIPFGYTLIVESGCIHGDAWFQGKYLMTMTSNHVAMRKADTVFLKGTGGNNASVSISGSA